jgi:2,3-bisphosphoglycerate-independent phosphoglycerate mutase
MKILFIFLDGVGLGIDDPQVNPFVRASLPNLTNLLDGAKLIANGQIPRASSGQPIRHTQQASLLPVDSNLGVEGFPQSATGQASLLTGKNVSAMLGAHEGPKPSPQVLDILQHGTLFSHFTHNGQKASLLNAYPPRYFHSLQRGHRLPGAIAQSAIYAGIPLKTHADLQQGNAISADFTAAGWHDHLGLTDTPVLDLQQAGERLAALSGNCTLAFFEYWLTDFAGHKQDMQAACNLLEQFDSVIGSLVHAWENEEGLILVTSDHGNLEDLGTRRHTLNDVPLLLIGSYALRERFMDGLFQARGARRELNLTDITPAILRLSES